MSKLEGLIVKRLTNECETKSKRLLETFDSRVEVSLVRFGYTNVVTEHVDFPDKFLLWDTVRPIQAVCHFFIGG